MFITLYFFLYLLQCNIRSSYGFCSGVLHETPPDLTRVFSSGNGQHGPATLRSMRFSNLDKSQQPQLLCDFLMEIGACSTSITDSAQGTEKEVPIFLEPDENLWNTAAVICGDHAVGKNLWEKCDVSAHFADSADLRQIAELVGDTLDIKLDYKVDEVPDRDWVIHVQQSWSPILVEGIILRFPWHTDDDVRQIIGKNKENSVAELRLEGGVAFGTGEHPTTQLCMSWIQNIIRNHNVSKLMDYGAGSGVLGLSACAISPSLDAVGVDIDVDAVRIANANAEINNLRMNNYLPPLEETEDSESKSILMKGHQKGQQEVLPEGLNAPIYDALVANILAAPLVTLSKTIAGLVKQNGFLGLSGILSQQGDAVVNAYSTFFDDVKIAEELNGWVLVTGTRNNMPAEK